MTDEVERNGQVRPPSASGYLDWAGQNTQPVQKPERVDALKEAPGLDLETLLEYSDDVQNSLTAAIEHARLLGRSLVTPDDLLYGIAAISPEPLASVLASESITTTGIDALAAARMSDVIPTTTSLDAQLGATTSLIEIFGDAQFLANFFSDEKIKTEHIALILIALSEPGRWAEGDGVGDAYEIRATDIFEELGIDLSALTDKILTQTSFTEKQIAQWAEFKREYILHPTFPTQIKKYLALYAKRGLALPALSNDLE